MKHQFWIKFTRTLRIGTTSLSSCHPLGKSDHNILLFRPSQGNAAISGTDQLITLRSKDPNGKALFAHALQNFDWSPMSSMPDCSTMLSFFNNGIQDLLDLYLPSYTVKRHSTDKPWVNDSFRRFVRIRQHAFRQGNIEKYRLFRNKIQRLAKSLRKKYYENRMVDLRSGDPRNWWMKVKQITGMSTKGDGTLTGLANNLCDGDPEKLANEANEFFQNVSSDLQPMNAEILEKISLEQSIETPLVIEQEQVERRLLSTGIFKSQGPDGIPNWILHDLAPSHQ